MTGREPRLGHWTSAAAEREYATLGASLREEAWADLHERGWRGLPDERDVATPFGATHVFHWDGADAPIVLLHGAGTSSLMWHPLLGELVGFDVYAIDTVGEPGLSSQTIPVRDRDDLVRWILAALDGLDLGRVHLVGASYGGWIALCTATVAPARVRTLTLVEPALTKPRPYFWVHGFGVLGAMALPGALRRRALRRLHMDVVADGDPRVVRLGRLGLTKYRRGVPGRVDPVTDEQLASVATPTLLLLGERSELHRSSIVAERARAHIRDVQVELVAGAGHSLPLDHAATVARAIRAFAAPAGDRR